MKVPFTYKIAKFFKIRIYTCPSCRGMNHYDFGYDLPCTTCKGKRFIFWWQALGMKKVPCKVCEGGKTKELWYTEGETNYHKCGWCNGTGKRLVCNKAVEYTNVTITPVRKNKHWLDLHSLKRKVLLFFNSKL